MTGALLGSSLCHKSGDADLVVVAVNPTATTNALLKALKEFPRAIVIETSSSKYKLQQELHTLSADSTRVLLSHPLSGREVSGPTAARSDLFLNRAWIIAPFLTTSRETLLMGEEFVSLMGAERYLMTPLEHDQLMATISHAPQFISSLLAASLNDIAHGAELAGQGLRDMTRLANSDIGMWREIGASNAAEISSTLKKMKAEMETLISALQNEEFDVIDNLMQSGREGKKLISGKHGALPRDYREFQIVIDDRPGALARIFLICDRIKVNIEDMRLEHSPKQETGLLTISISPNDSDRLSSTLEEEKVLFFNLGEASL
jgi:prephenate dehydrogenase